MTQDAEQQIAEEGEPRPSESITLASFFDDILMTNTNGKEKIECFGCSG